MARIPSVDYGSRVDTDAAYPQGKAKNIVGTTKGTGTPLEEKWLNDDWGFKQAILKEANITPSGSSDNADDSQYLDGIKRITRNDKIEIKTLADAVADTSAKVDDYVRISDRGNGLFQYQSGQTPNTFDIIECSSNPTLSLVLHIESNDVYCTYFGAVGDYYLPNGSVNPTPTDNTPFIQAALNYKGAYNIWLNGVKGLNRTGYGCEDVIYLGFGQKLFGTNQVQVELVKTTNNLGVGAGIHPNDGAITYVVDAMVIKTNPDNSSSLGQGVQNLTLRSGSPNMNAYGIYASYMSKSEDKDITIVGAYRSYFCHDQFLCSMDRVWARNDAALDRADVGFMFVKGTSLTMNGCWSKRVVRGYELGQLQYSFINAACDDFTFSGYNGGQSITYNSIGVELAVLSEGGFAIGAGARQINISGGILGVIDSDGLAANTSFFNFNGSTVTISGFRMPALGSNAATSMDIFKLTGAASVEFNASDLPPASQYRNLVTFDNDFAYLARNGADRIVSQRNKEDIKIGSSQFKNGVFGVENNNLLGFPSEPANLPLGSMQYENTYVVSSSSSEVLTIIKPAGNYRVTIYLEGIISSASSESVISGVTGVNNGNDQPLNQEVIVGDGAFQVIESWNDGVLSLSVGGGADYGMIKIKVIARVSTGTPELRWFS